MTKYIFYLVGREDEALEYHSEEWEKEEMNNDILYNQYKDYPYCVREKWIDGLMRYSNIFRLNVRRNNPTYTTNKTNHAM